MISGKILSSSSISSRNVKSVLRLFFIIPNIFQNLNKCLSILSLASSVVVPARKIKLQSDDCESNNSLAACFKSLKINSSLKFFDDKSIKKADENEEVVFLEKKDEIDLTDEINNARKTRRRSSASIE